MSLFGVSVQTLSAVSSIALTAMSTVVASVALMFSFRQNVGWQPVVLATHSQMSGRAGTEWRFKLSVSVEFWNRRKYPVVVRSVRSTVSGVTLRNATDSASEKAAYVRNNVIVSRPDSVVNSGAHEALKVEGEFEKQFLDALTPLFLIEVMYFDPYRNKEVVLRAEHRFFYPEMGWAKSEEQRELIRQLPPPWVEQDA